MDAKTQHIIDEVKKVVLSFDENSKLVLFGSRARGDFHEESDWDFLMLTSLDAGWGLRMNISDKIFKIELEENTCIQVMVRNEKEWEEGLYTVMPIYKNIKNEGITL
ncbi:nucleotidyltransferase domain-containing protein [Parasediminibacterium sp. JCM 36343]|uniref:nucleotidyltransferase domain-containing protein n=1 Tax=Parasediminibacterium sp. JCM 36343 TaxID=3374279 RepID=UPI0039786454